MKVEFDGITKKYGDFVAVRDLKLNIKSGALHFLLGPSGCGKTTSLRMLAGLESVSSGRLLFDGVDVTQLPAAERGIGMVFQNYALWPHMTVRKNIEYGLKLKKMPAADLKKRFDEAVGITQLGPFVERFPGQLSGGQQQRVALARALAIRPKVLLLDEPLSNLDAKLRLEMRENISRIHAETGITTIYVTHDQKEALSMGTSVSVMHKGQLIQTGSPRELYNDPETPFIASFIGETNLVPGTVIGRSGSAGSVGAYRVQTTYGEVQVIKAVKDFQPQDKVLISIRPESFQSQQACDTSDAQIADAPGGNIFSLKVTKLTYLGESEQLSAVSRSSTVQGDDNQTLKLTLFNVQNAIHGVGDALDCFLDPKDPILLEASDQEDYLLGGT